MTTTDDVVRLGTEHWCATCPHCGWTSPRVADRTTAIQARERHDCDDPLTDPVPKDATT